MSKNGTFLSGLLAMVLAAAGCTLPSTPVNLPGGLSDMHSIMTSEAAVPKAGLIYTHKFIPLDINASRTPVSEIESEGNIKHFQYYVDVRWDSNAIGEIARRAGIETLYYADLEILSVLGIWRQYWVHLYGKPKETR